MATPLETIRREVVWDDGSVSFKKVVEGVTPTADAHLATKGYVDSVGGGGGGDEITVNGAAVTDADFDDSTPGAPADGVNVRWQKDASSPANISANVPNASASAGGAVSTGTQTFAGQKTFNNGLKADQIDEKTAAAGVTADSVKMQDGGVQAAPTSPSVVGLQVTPDAEQSADNIKVVGGGEGTLWSVDASGNVVMADSATVDGVDVSTHDHSGAGQGGTVDHTDLANKGMKTHSTIDSMLDKVWQVQLSDGSSQSTTNATTWLSIINESIAANAMGANGKVRAHVAGRYNNNSGSNKVIELRISFGGTVIYQDASSIPTNASDRGWEVWLTLYNRNSTSSQRAAINFGIGRAGNATTGVGNFDQLPEKSGPLRSIDPTKDTTSAQTLLVEIRQNTTATGVVLEKDHALMETFKAA